MLDFALALYLGFRHESSELRPWARFTTGVPAALGSPRLAWEVARELAALQACERATLAASTLHLFWDLFGVLADSPSAIFVDAGTYPIARWGVERAAARGVPASTFGHHDPVSLRDLLKAQVRRRSRPMIVTDGFCPSCGRPAPIGDYLIAAREFGGLLVIDDTQALGIVGHSPGPDAPYGRGGGGMLRRANVTGPEVVLASSMAKAFGVPLAVLSGSGEVVERFETQSETRMHCSPPSIATLHAAEHALQLNREQGDTVRLRLACLVHHFRTRLREAGLPATGGLFPVQTLAAISGSDVAKIHAGLLRSGVRAVLHRSRPDASPRLSFLITARHTFAQLDRALNSLFRVVRSTEQPRVAAR